MNKIQKIEARGLINACWFFTFAACVIFSLWNAEELNHDIDHILDIYPHLRHGWAPYHSSLPGLTAYWIVVIIFLLPCELGIIRDDTPEESEILSIFLSKSKIDKKPLRGISHLASVERKIKEGKRKDEKIKGEDC